MKVAVTGYNGSGASAVCSLLKEYENVSFYFEKSSYEHIPFYTPNGLFDLEYKLLYRNNMHRSDEAIQSFLTEMNRLDKNDFGWNGGYSKIIAQNRFNEIVQEFVDSLVQYNVAGRWSYDMLGLKWNIKKIISDSIRKCLNKPVNNFGQVIEWKQDGEILCSFVNEDEYFKAAKQFVRNYLNLFEVEGKEVIAFDHLLMPSDAWKIPQYFDNDFRLIIVERDIRDMFLCAKYVRPSQGIVSKYPLEVDMFERYWKGLRGLEREASEQVLRIKFEELVYNYEDTVHKIEDFCGLASEQHIFKDQYFIREKALSNTQLFLNDKDWEEEVKGLSKNMSEYIYKFPYRRNVERDGK